MTALLRLARKSLLLWFGATFLAGGLVSLSMGSWVAIQELRYRDEGRVTEAVVLTGSIEPASQQGSSPDRFSIVYHFDTPEGKTIEGNDTVDLEGGDHLEAGSTLDITYLPDNPGTSRVVGSDEMGTALAALLVGGVFALIGGFFFFTNAYRLGRQWSILRTGEFGQGTVLAIGPTNTSINRVRQWKVQYTYRDPLGSVHTGASGYLAPDEAHAYAVGDSVRIRVSREHFEESVWDVPPAPRTRLDVGRLGRWAGRWAYTLALAFLAILVGEIVIPVTGLDDSIVRHEAVLTRITVAVMILGFTMFMGAIVTAILTGVRTPWSRPDEGSSYHDQFSIREAKNAWRWRAWRDSPRWRVNFVVMAGIPLLAVGLFGLFIVIAPNGIRFLCGAALMVAIWKTAIAIVRA